MIALQIEHIRDLMNKLLLSQTFDRFLVSEASMTTFTTFTIDGQLHPEFYDADTILPGAETQTSWESIRPFCLSVFRGKRLPLAFHFILQLPHAEIPDLLFENGLTISEEDVFGLFLNIQYRNETLTVTTGSSLRVFSGDRSLDRAWDDRIRRFLEEAGIS